MDYSKRVSKMLKKMNKILSLISASSIVTTLVCSTLATSCSESKEIEITAIHLYPESDTLRPNESIPIRAVVEPSFRRTNDLDWELVDCPYPEITISDKGVVSADASLSISDLPKITVKASHGESVSATCELTVFPLPTYDFQGFAGNVIRYVNRVGQVCSQPLLKTGEYTYSTSQNIDVFEMAQEIPEPLTSFIDFTPLIPSSSLKYMRFQLRGGEYARHAIEWDTYDDGQWTDTIPKFNTIDPAVLFDTIDVYFACDPNVCLTINLNAWQNPGQQASDVKVTYDPVEKDDPHTIEYDAESTYRCYLYCPATSSVGTFTQTLSRIYVYRPKYEFLGLTFQVEPSPILDPSIAKMLQTTPEMGSMFEPKMYERPFDHLRYYQFDFTYEFLLEGREHTAEYWQYDALPLFSILINDYDGETTYLAATIDFYLEWI